MRIDNKYLYGTDDVPDIPAEVVMRRLELLNDALAEVKDMHYLARDNERKNAILKAIQFWENIK